MNRKYTIAYLAPEIPALSATFVYNEILAVEKHGIQIVPISVHVPQAAATEKNLKGLMERTIYLYRRSLSRFLLSNVMYFLKFPFRYIHTLKTAARDAMCVGLTSHTGQGLLYRFFIASSVAQILQRYGCLHLHTHFAHIPTDISMYASRLSNISFSFTAHANDLFERGWLIKEKVDRATAAVTISEFNRNFMVSRGADTKKVHIVRCGVDTGNYAPLLETKGVKTVPVIGSLGRLVEKKGMDTLIAAMAGLSRNGFNFRLEIAGDGPMLSELKEMVLEKGLNGKVRFMGALPHEEALKWFRGLDLFILACRKDSNGDQDGIPVVLMEAMAMGIPTISTRISGIPELIENGETGLLAEPDNPDSLADRVERFFQDPSSASAMARKAKEHIAGEFDADVNIRRLIRLFRGGKNE